jgi:alpha-L-fucosidase
VTVDPTWSTASDMTVRTGAGDPNGSVWSPQMALAPLREHDWFFRPGREDRIQPLDALVRMYEHSVGLNANLILGITPDRRGLVPDADVQRMAELGNAVRRRYTVGDLKTSGKGDVVTLDLPRPTEISRAVVMEEIEHGQRIRRFVLEASTSEGWQELRTGESIGHKRIVSFPPLRATALRLRSPEAVAEPRLRLLAAIPSLVASA